MKHVSIKWTYGFLALSLVLVPIFIFQNCAEKGFDLGKGSLVSKSPAAPQIYGGHVHSCYLFKEAVKCWGLSSFGEVGTAAGSTHPTPQLVSNMESAVTYVATGVHNTCAIKSGALYCWGLNNHSQFGTDPVATPSSSAPQAIAALNSDVTHVSVGFFTICAIKNEALYCWGRNDYGQVGVGNLNPQPAPVILPGMDKDVIEVDVAQHPGIHGCAIKKGGALYCWGYNQNGELGDGTTVNRTSPVPLAGMTSGVTAVSTGAGYTCAIKDSQLYCWGYNVDGRLGIGPYDGQNRAAPTLVTAFTGKKVSKIDAGGSHTCALADGSMYCWGKNNLGAIGVGPAPAEQRVPFKVLDNVSDIAVTGDNDGSRGASFAIVGKAFYSWGANGYGILANGTTNSSNAPTVPAFSFQ